MLPLAGLHSVLKVGAPTSHAAICLPNDCRTRKARSRRKRDLTHERSRRSAHASAHEYGSDQENVHERARLPFSVSITAKLTVLLVVGHLFCFHWFCSSAARCLTILQAVGVTAALQIQSSLNTHMHLRGIHVAAANGNRRIARKVRNRTGKNLQAEPKKCENVQKWSKTSENR